MGHTCSGQTYYPAEANLLTSSGFGRDADLLEFDYSSVNIQQKKKKYCSNFFFNESHHVSHADGKT